jgi:hypothetical protein
MFSFAQADQLAWITEEQAVKAVAFLRKQESLLMYCGCCNEHDAQMVKVLDVNYKETPGGEYFEVYVTGLNQRGEKVTLPLDLAYVYFKKKKKVVNVGRHLGFECNPCNQPKSWLKP